MAKIEGKKKKRSCQNELMHIERVNNLIRLNDKVKRCAQLGTAKTKT